MSKRHLIINADDFGSCQAANAAIEHLFSAGFITTTTLMTPCPWAEDAAHRALENKKMVVGLHLTTTAEYDYYKWGPVNRACQSLMDDRGYFYKTAAENLAHATEADMAAELEAQYNWMSLRGLAPEHVDSHMGTVYGLAGPPHLAAALGLCAKHGLNFRLPKTAEGFMANPPPQLQALAAQAAAQAAAIGVGLPDALFTHDGNLGPDDSYEGLKQYYMALVRRCPEGVSELFVHPCIESPELKAINAQWQKRVWEYRLMLDDDFYNCIQGEGIALTTYAQAPFTA